MDLRACVVWVLEMRLEGRWAIVKEKADVIGPAGMSGDHGWRLVKFD